jgi:hypothetical protein
MTLGASYRRTMRQETSNAASFTSISPATTPDHQIESLVDGEVVAVTVDPQQKHHQRPRRAFVAIN